MKIEPVILAAGMGKRMHSSLPKVLHRVGGRPMLLHLLETVLKIEPHRVHIVVGHGKDRVIEAIMEHQSTMDLSALNWVEQAEQRGTGHAVLQAISHVDSDSDVLVLNGDTPLISLDTLDRVRNPENGVNLITVDLEAPGGMGRILRDETGSIVGIVEEKDASEQQKRIKETNTNCICTKAKNLSRWLPQIGSNNAQKEIYLTDVVACAVGDGVSVHGISISDANETHGVNSKLDLEKVERILQRQHAGQLMSRGVMVMDASRLDVRGICHFGNDCVVDINVILEGDVVVGDDVHIGPNCLIRNAEIGNGSVIEANSVIDSAVIGSQCNIGPFARIRPQTHIEDKARIGNFVEVKKSTIGAGSKVNHLSYVGDSDIGKDVNIGAGVITCNYDGANKYETRIGNNVFVGSDSQLVAPVVIEDGATIGAGSTITGDVGKNVLAVSRARQRNIENWKRPVKETERKKS